MSHAQLYPVPEHTKAKTLVTNEQYLAMYEESVKQPEKFWAEHGKRISWFTPFTKVKDTSFDLGNVHVNWFSDGSLNASYNCLDRHLPAKANHVAYYWEGDEPGVQKAVTYQELYDEVCQLANAMRTLGAVSYTHLTLPTKRIV